MIQMVLSYRPATQKLVVDLAEAIVHSHALQRELQYLKPAPTKKVGISNRKSAALVLTLFVSVRAEIIETGT